MNVFTPQNTSLTPAFFSVFQTLKFGELHFKHDPQTGLMAIIAIHNTFSGPAMGGCRFLPYQNIEAAIIDALRLAHSMSYKAAISDLPFGGGKAVMLHPDQLVDRVALFKAFGQFVHELGGRYITAEDSGTGVQEMDIIRTITPFVTGHSHQIFSHKDPSPLTAMGIRSGIQAAVKYQLKRTSLDGLHVAIQGVGHVGYHLAKELYEQGAKLTICDLNMTAVERCRDEFKAAVVLPDQIHKIACDVFSPCALSNAITQKNIDEIQAPIVAGSANNQLESPQLAKVLKQRGILYAPDYAINAGGLIYVASQYMHQNEHIAKEKVAHIYDTLLQIFEIADKEALSTLEVADRLAESKFPI